MTNHKERLMQVKNTAVICFANAFISTSLSQTTITLLSAEDSVYILWSLWLNLTNYYTFRLL